MRARSDRACLEGLQTFLRGSWSFGLRVPRVSVGYPTQYVGKRSPSVWLSIYLSICIYIYIYLSLSLSLSTYLPVYLSVSLSVGLPVCLFVCLSICVSRLRTYLPTHPPTRLPTYLLTYPYVTGFRGTSSFRLTQEMTFTLSMRRDPTGQHLRHREWWLPLALGLPVRFLI